MAADKTAAARHRADAGIEARVRARVATLKLDEQRQRSLALAERMDATAHRLRATQPELAELIGQWSAELRRSVA